jgi:hypothetical protein
MVFDYWACINCDFTPQTTKIALTRNDSSIKDSIQTMKELSRQLFLTSSQNMEFYTYVRSANWQKSGAA